MTRAAPALAIAVLAACAPRGAQPSPGSAQAQPAPGVVDAATALSLAASGVRVVDVRAPGEFAAGHVPGAVNIPYDQIALRAGEVGPREAPVVLYCRSGHRSGIAAETLRGLGYTKVYDAQRYDALARAAQGS